MRFYYSVFLVFIISLISGCSSINSGIDQARSLLNPTKIHLARNRDSEAYEASEIPVNDYYNALALAKKKYKIQNDSPIGIMETDPMYVKNYIEEGLGLIDTYCLRWFQKIDDLQRLLAYQNKNVNVVTQLGTAALGLGGANSTIVGGYGAINTAYAGLSENFNAAFIVAPTSSKVKRHIEAAMKAEAKSIRDSANTLNFKQAYVRLEKYADFCTYSRAKEIVDASLDLTKTGVNTNTGQPETVVNSN